ncbi:PTS sugar transporter subunit IIA [bacterium]|nr:PTS sugar transporter subunit IIA [bacterium]
MDLARKIVSACVGIENEELSKSAILKKIAKKATQAPSLAGVSAATIEKKLAAREAIGSTGFGNQIAIPHCSLDGIDNFIIGLLQVPAGVEFDAMDGKKVKLLAFIISPESKRTQHIQYLAAVSRIFKSTNQIDALLAETTAATLFEKFLSLALAEKTGHQTKKNFLFHIFIQDEERFNDILEIFSEMNISQLSIIEINNAGHYLHHMPLFASFWNESPYTFNRLIMGVIGSAYLNETLRRLNLIEDEMESQGIMYTVQELCFSSGALEF